MLDILDRNPSGFELQGLFISSMYLVRARIDDDKINSPGVNVETNSGSIGPLSEIRFKDLTGQSSSHQSSMLS